MKTIVLLAGLTGAALLSADCHTVNTLEPAQPSYERSMISDKRVITDSSLARKVRFVGVNESLTPEGFLRVQVELENTKSSLQKFSYKWEWFDADGMIVDGPLSVAVSRQIEGKETLFVSGVAPRPTARDFRLKLYENAP